jgi:hypothetical protein
MSFSSQFRFLCRILAVFNTVHCGKHKGTKKESLVSVSVAPGGSARLYVGIFSLALVSCSVGSLGIPVVNGGKDFVICSSELIRISG